MSDILLDKVRHARSRLILIYPWMAHALLSVRFVNDNHILTAATDGRHIFYNSDCMSKIDDIDIELIIAHELWHIILGHCFNKKDGHHKKWNIAYDHVINNFLLDCGFSPPRSLPWVCDRQYQGMHADKVYRLLPDNCTGGFDEHIPGKLLKKDNKSINDVFVKTIVAAKLAGVKSDLIDIALEKIETDKQIPWHEIITNTVINKCAKEDYTWKKISRRGLSQGLMLPSMYGTSAGFIAFIVDTSASMDAEEIAESLLLIASAIEAVHPCKMLYIEADIEINKLIEVQDLYFPKIGEVKGGGGTSFCKSLAEAERQMCDTIVYFTDMYGDYPDNCHTKDLFWVTKTKDVKPPFGHVININ